MMEWLDMPTAGSTASEVVEIPKLGTTRPKLRSFAALIFSCDMEGGTGTGHTQIWHERSDDPCHLKPERRNRLYSTRLSSFRECDKLGRLKGVDRNIRRTLRIASRDDADV